MENGVRGGMCNAVYRYAKANNKYMKNFDKNVSSSYLDYLDANNLYGWAMSETLSANDFKWIETNALSTFNENAINNYDENSDTGYILEIDIEYPKELFNKHKDLPFIPERMKINKCNKLVCTSYDKENYVIHIRALKQALNRGLVLKKVHKVIKFYHKA